MGVCFHPLLKTTKILLNNFTYMTFSNKTLTCGFYFICRYKLLETSQRCYKCSTRPFRKTTPLTTLAHFCSNHTFPNAKITKCNCFAQTHVLPQYCCILCLCWLCTSPQMIPEPQKIFLQKSESAVLLEK